MIIDVPRAVFSWNAVLDWNLLASWNCPYAVLFNHKPYDAGVLVTQFLQTLRDR